MHNIIKNQTGLVLALLAATCLHTGLGAYMAAGDDDSIAGLARKDIPAVIDPVRSLPEIAVLDDRDLVDGLADEVRASNRSQTILVEPKKAVSILKTRSDESPILRKEIRSNAPKYARHPKYRIEMGKPPEFRNTVILYRRPPETENYSLAKNVVSEKRKVEKTSLVAKVLPVFKKPYNWLKALGSRMF